MHQTDTSCNILVSWTRYRRQIKLWQIEDFQSSQTWSCGKSSLIIPPPAQGTEQMTKENVLKTKSVASLRIHVERAIGRIKWFHILKQTMPLALVYGSPLVPWEITFFAPYGFTLYGVRQIIIWRTPNNYMADAI